jgi:hypothetical protein
MTKILTRGIAILALTTMGAAIVPAAAFADTTATTTTKAPSSWQLFRQAWKSYGYKLRAINTTYHSSVLAARASFDTSMSTSTTPAEKQAARVAFRAALVVALNTRDASITALGTPPVPPAGYNGTAYVNGFQAANVAYRAAVVSAQANFTVSLSAAATPAQRAAARLTLRAAVSVAAAARAEALLNLGTPPVHPGK